MPSESRLDTKCQGTGHYDGTIVLSILSYDQRKSQSQRIGNKHKCAELHVRLSLLKRRDVFTLFTDTLAQLLLGKFLTLALVAQQLGEDGKGQSPDIFQCKACFSIVES